LGVGHGAEDPTPETLTVTKNGRAQDPHKVLAPVKKKKKANKYGAI
jgi:hypothetical protein